MNQVWQAGLQITTPLHAGSSIECPIGRGVLSINQYSANPSHTPFATCCLLSPVLSSLLLLFSFYPSFYLHCLRFVLLLQKPFHCLPKLSALLCQSPPFVSIHQEPWHQSARSLPRVCYRLFPCDRPILCDFIAQALLPYFSASTRKSGLMNLTA